VYTKLFLFYTKKRTCEMIKLAANGREKAVKQSRVLEAIEKIQKNQK
jgi:hypothetical protein